MTALDRFSEPTRSWFAAAFAAPTAAQEGAWDAVAAGHHALVVAPTGSGKTLSAFLWSLDRLLTSARPEERSRRTRVLYVSPLKALAVDVERNLRAPLAGIRHTAERLGARPGTQPGSSWRGEVTVGVRSGDTNAADRRRLVSHPPDILITTPESLFLMLTSQARETLHGVETVIVDEVHALAGGKRGAHLAVTLERLDALLERPAQRIGLSATVRPHEEVARFLGGSAPVQIVAPASDKQWDLRVVVPVEDMTAPGGLGADTEEGSERATSIWPHVEEHVADLIQQHRSTIVFANSRRLAERLTARLNEIAEERAGVETLAGARSSTDGGEVGPPAQVMAQSGQSHGAPPVLAKAHHGSVSKEQRALIEDDLKRGRLPAVVATSSLELGIDMGAVDLVVQIESPPSVASALQRVGRAGHQVGEVSRGVLFPKHRGDLAQTAVAVRRMREGAIEELRIPANPLDVLAQQVVAAVAVDSWDVDELYAVLRRAAPFASLPRSAYDAVLDLLAGRYPSDDFAELRPRIVWDRVGGTLTGRPGAQRLAVTSGGTIPDRGLFGVFLVGGEGPASQGGRRVGELDEEMVYESRVGDVFALGATSWRIEDITHDRVLVTPAPGVPGRLPFWKGDTLGRPAELGAAVGAFTQELASLPEARGLDLARAGGLDDYAAANLLAYLGEQREATRVLPSDRTILVERFRDELGDWRLVVHSPYGTPVHAPWALAINARLRERFGIDGQAMASDDGIVIRIPDSDAEPPAGDLVVFDPDEIADLVTTEVGGSALFASRFRECAARALLLPRRDPGRRSPLWQQRQRSAALLEVAARYPSFPIVLEAVREVLQDVYDLPALIALLRPHRASRGHGDRRGHNPAVAVRAEPAVRLRRPVPLRGRLPHRRAARRRAGARPGAARRAARTRRAARAARPRRPRRGRGRAAAAHPRPPGPRRRGRRRPAPAARSPRIQARWQSGAPRAPTSPPGWPSSAPPGGWRRCGSRGSSAGWRWRTSAGCATRSGSRSRPAPPRPSPTPSTTRSATWSAASPAPTARSPPRWSPSASAWAWPSSATPWSVSRRRGGCSTASSGPPAADRSGATPRCCAGYGGAVWPDCARRSSRSSPTRWAGSCPRGSGSGRRRPRGVVRCAASTACWPSSSSWPARRCPPRPWSRSCCRPGSSTTSPPCSTSSPPPARCSGPGHGSLPGADGWVSLHLADQAELTLPEPTGAGGDDGPGELHTAVLEALAPGGAWFFRQLADTVAGLRGEPVDDRDLAGALWDLVWTGRVSNDTLTPLRSLTRSGATTHRSRRPPPRARVGGASRRLPSRTGPPETAGRWTLLPALDTDPTRRAHAVAERLLDRHGVVTRGAVVSERVAGGFAAVYRVLTAFEDSGRCRRGYFVASLGAAQFGTAGAVDRLRTYAEVPPDAAARGGHSRGHRPRQPLRRRTALARARRRGVRPPSGPQGRCAGGPGRRAPRALRRARRPHAAHLERRARAAGSGGGLPGRGDPAGRAGPAHGGTGRRRAAARLRAHPAASGAAGRRVRVHPARSPAAGVTACPRATPSTAPRAGSTPRSPGRC